MRAQVNSTVQLRTQREIVIFLHKRGCCGLKLSAVEKDEVMRVFFSAFASACFSHRNLPSACSAEGTSGTFTLGDYECQLEQWRAHRHSCIVWHHRLLISAANSTGPADPHIVWVIILAGGLNKGFPYRRGARTIRRFRNLQKTNVKCNNYLHLVPPPGLLMACFKWLNSDAGLWFSGFCFLNLLHRCEAWGSFRAASLFDEL